MVKTPAGCTSSWVIWRGARERPVASVTLPSMSVSRTLETDQVPAGAPAGMVATAWHHGSWSPKL